MSVPGINTESLPLSHIHTCTHTIVLFPAASLCVVRYFYPYLGALLNLMGSEGVSTPVSACLSVLVVFRRALLTPRSFENEAWWDGRTLHHDWLGTWVCLLPQWAWQKKRSLWRGEREKKFAVYFSSLVFFFLSFFWVTSRFPEIQALNSLPDTMQGFHITANPCE